MSKRSGVYFRIDQPLKEQDDGSTIRHFVKAKKVEKFKMKQTRLLTRSDVRKFANGQTKTAPPRAVRVDISFVIPEDEVARQRAKYDKFLKSQEK